MLIGLNFQIPSKLTFEAQNRRWKMLFKHRNMAIKFVNICNLNLIKLEICDFVKSSNQWTITHLEFGFAQLNGFVFAQVRRIYFVKPLTPTGVGQIQSIISSKTILIIINCNKFYSDYFESMKHHTFQLLFIQEMYYLLFEGFYGFIHKWWWLSV